VNLRSGNLRPLDNPQFAEPIKEKDMTQLSAHPAIFIPPVDFDRLLAVAEGTAKREPDVAHFLLQELGRASIKALGPEDDFVRMQSHVRFRDNSSGRIRDVQLVYPEEANPSVGRISVLTPVGTALIGLSRGQSIRWDDRSGKRKSITVLDVWNASEASPSKS
jgi:regulator of nucleoside diphosphate kinase